MIALPPGEVQEAIAAYREAIRLKPDDAKAHGNLGGVLSSQGKADEAIAAAARRSGSSPTLPRPTTTSASPCTARRSWTRRSPNYREAIRLKPDYAVAHNNLERT